MDPSDDGPDADTDTTDDSSPVTTDTDDTDGSGASDTDVPLSFEPATLAALEDALTNLHQRGSGTAVLEVFPDACGPDFESTGVCASLFTDTARGAVCAADDLTCNQADLDKGNGKLGFPQAIVPFQYYYSAVADYTFVVCAQDLTLAMCSGRMEARITDADIAKAWSVTSRGCKVADVYLGSDPRITTGPTP